MFSASELLEEFLQTSTSSTQQSSDFINITKSVASMTSTVSQTKTLITAPFRYQPSQNRQVAIFYNLFIPEDQGDEGEQRAKNIINDQLDQIGSSHMIENGRISLYYVTIGKELDSSFSMTSICERNKLECVHVQHYPSGNFEDVTLQQVHEFCSEYPDFSAIYIHSKGSYHDMEKPDISQTSWRRNMMSAVTSQQCLEAVSGDSQCTACGLVALPWSMTHFPGNFFLSKCSYINKLIAPFEFAGRMGEAVADVRVKVLESVFVADLFETAAHYYGVGRFASEQWLGSHPSIVPCDLSTLPAIKPWYQPGPPQHDFQFSMFPRFPIHEEGYPYVAKRRLKQALANPKLRFREYFLLPGNLYRWFYLYGEAPPENSWVWLWFPDGAFWKEQVQKHGSAAVDIVTSKYSGGATVSQKVSQKLLAMTSSKTQA